MKICKTCILPETFPGIRFNDDGVCHHCQNFKGKAALDKQRKRYLQKFEMLLTTEHAPRGSYDVLVAYSGGKDSTFTLDILKNRFNLRVLALTFDHGFVSPYALENVRKVVETIGVDHVIFKPDLQLVRRIFRFSLESEFHPPKALERASSICNSCMGLVKFLTLRTAIEKHVPFVAYGWSPGQAPIQSAIFKNHPSFIRKAQDLFLRPLEQAVGPEVRAYFLENRHFDSKSFPYNINLLAFLDYDEKAVYQRIQELGWKKPKDTDPNSTNCLLNTFANQAHLKRHHYHPYAMELAELVREGVLSRAEAFQRLSEGPDRKIIENVKARLEL
jgi:tRNA(Ile)-lysidine synthase TilS/MesJ